MDSLTCETCLKSYSRKDSLARHRLIHAKTPTPGTSNTDNHSTCNICNKVLLSHNMLRHMKLHDTAQGPICQDTNQVNASKGKFKAKKCPECGDFYKYLYNLASHLDTTHGLTYSRIREILNVSKKYIKSNIHLIQFDIFLQSLKEQETDNSTSTADQNNSSDIPEQPNMQVPQQNNNSPANQNEQQHQQPASIDVQQVLRDLDLENIDWEATEFDEMKQDIAPPPAKRQKLDSQQNEDSNNNVSLY